MEKESFVLYNVKNKKRGFLMITYAGHQRNRQGTAYFEKNGE